MDGVRRRLVVESLEDRRVLAGGATLLVPQDYVSIQAGIDAAQDGDLVLVAPGTYAEQISLIGKTITLASEYHTTGDPSRIDQTILDGGGANVITVDATVGPATTITGFTIQNGVDGISAWARLDILNNIIRDTSDGIDFESGSGGLVRGNLIEWNSDDGIDLDGAVDVIIEQNTIRNNGDDGIEIRLHDYTGPMLNVVIQDNDIVGSSEDGIQLIDYPNLSNRSFLIQRNLVRSSAMVGLGMMDNGVTTEDFRAASIEEPIRLLHNTFIDNPYAITGGDNLVALNNLFVNSTTLGLKNVDGGSIAAYNLFWNNGVDHQGSIVDSGTSVFADPLLDTDVALQTGSPAIDTGTAFFEWNGMAIINTPPGCYVGSAPDMGMHEFGNSGMPACNSAPVANGQSLATLVDKPLGILLTASDPNNDPLTYSVETGPSTGTLSGTAPNLTYTPASGFVGTDSFTFLANDGTVDSNEGTVTITVSEATSSPTVVEVRVASSSDDAEEKASGSVSLRSSDLELIFDKSDQTVGIRFTSLAVPQGANIVDAYVQFQVDETPSGTTTLTIEGEAVDDALTFSSSSGNISSRPRTAASTGWSPAAWPTVGAAGADQRTDSIAAVIQEIVDRPGWSSGNSLVVIITGTGERVAESYNGDASAAPLLHVEYLPGNAQPTTSGIADVLVHEDDPDTVIDLFAAFHDLEDADSELTYTIEGNTDPLLFDATTIDPVQGTLTLDYAPAATGTSDITVRATDTGVPGLFVDATFTVTVAPINEAPTTSGIPDVLVIEDSAATDVDLFAAFDDSHDPDTALFYSEESNTNPALFASTSIDGSAGTLTLQYAPDANGTADIEVRATDMGFPSMWVETTFTVSVSEVNDGPLRLAGTVSDLTVLQNSATTSLGLAALDYGPGGGADESGQVLDIAVTAVPSSGLGDVLLSDGTTVVMPGSYTLQQLQGMQFVPATDAIGGPETFSYTITDNGTTGGVPDPQTLTESLQITVIENVPDPVTLEIRIAAASDDAEERASGSMALGSSDLEMVLDRDNQVVGLRFTGVAVPFGATITNAFVQFQVDEPHTTTTDLTIEGQASDNAPTFVNSSGNISSRPRTNASRAWSPAPWTTVGEAGADQQTPDIAAVIQEIVDRPGWSSGNALAVIITGTGKRVAEAYNGDPNGAALLHIEYLGEGAVVPQYAIKHTPYLQLGNAPLDGYSGSEFDQVEVLWQTVPVGSGSDDSFTVDYRLADPAEPWTAAGHPIAQLDTGVEGRINHSVTIDGLAYDTDYEYRVTHRRDGTAIDAYQNTFRTRLAAGDSTPFMLAAYGDSADGGADFPAVQNRINGSAAAFSLLLGDLAYSNGTHQDFDDRFDPNLVPEATTWNAGHIDYPGIGNHDTNTANGQPWEDNYSVPIQVAGVNAVATPPGEERPEHLYSFDYGDVHFVAIDTNSRHDSTRLGAQLDWAVADLNASSAQWKVVFGHHAIAGVPDKSEHPGQNYYQQIVSRLGGADVDLLLMGHSHTYSWTYPLTGEAGGEATYVLDTDKDYSKGTGLIQVVSGVGGKSVRPGDYSQFPFVAAGYSTDTLPVGEFGFSQIDVTPTQLTVSYIAADDGAVIDAFTITDGPDTTPPTASLLVPLDNGPQDTDPQAGAVAVQSTQSTFQIHVSDIGDGVDDATVVPGVVSVTKDNLPLSESTDYAFSYDTTADVITLTPSGGDFDDGLYEITLGAGPAKIADQAGNEMGVTVLTVHIDTTIVGPQTVTFRQGVSGYAGTVDTFLDEGSPNTDRSASVELNVDGSSGGAVVQTLLQFTNIVGSNPGQVPVGAQIQSATLELQITNPGHSLQLHRMLQSWTDTDTWNSMGAGVQADDVEAVGVADAGTASVSSGVLSIDVRSSLEAWVAGPATNEGWAILPTGNNGVDFDSAEGSTPPRLTVEYTAGAPLLAEAKSPDAVRAAEPVTAATLAPIVQEAIERLTTAYGAESVDGLAGVVIDVVDLPSNRLGQASAGEVLIDSDAAGWGWFVDRTPGDVAEFSRSEATDAWVADPGSPAFGRVDLLSVVIHELAHSLGHEHSSAGGVMQPTLAAGMRRLPVGPADPAGVHAAMEIERQVPQDVTALDAFFRRL